MNNRGFVRLRLLFLTILLIMIGVSVSYVQGPLTPLGNLRVRTDSNGYLMVTDNTAGAQGPLTPLGNLRGRSDSNGYLMVTCDNCGGSFDATAEDALTWSDGANASNAWTFDVSGTDTIFTAGNDLVAFEAATAVVGDTSGASTLYLYNVVDDLLSPTNFERAGLTWTGDDLIIATQDGGTGTVDDIIFQIDGTTRVTFQGTTSQFASTIVLSDNRFVEFDQNSDPAAIDCDNAGEATRLSVNDGTAGTSAFYGCDQAGSTTGWIPLRYYVTPTVSSGFGTTPSIAAENGPAAFTVNVGTGGTATAGVIGLPTATTGWICHVENVTSQAANDAEWTRQTASSTTTATIENQDATGAATAWSASDVLSVTCAGY